MEELLNQCLEDKCEFSVTLYCRQEVAEMSPRLVLFRRGNMVYLRTHDEFNETYRGVEDIIMIKEISSYAQANSVVDAAFSKKDSTEIISDIKEVLVPQKKLVFDKKRY